jgi:hypothetical protein
MAANVGTLILGVRTAPQQIRFALVRRDGDNFTTVRRVDELLALGDRIERRYLAAVAKIDELAPAILAKAFRGELVSQDPADEPADRVLERIRRETKEGTAIEELPRTRVAVRRSRTVRS